MQSILSRSNALRPFTAGPIPACCSCIGRSRSTSTGLAIPSPTALLASFPISDLSLRRFQNHEQFTSHLCSSASSDMLFSGEILCQVILPQKLLEGRPCVPLDTPTVGYTAMRSRFATLLFCRPVASAFWYKCFDRHLVYLSLLIY